MKESREITGEISLMSPHVNLLKNQIIGLKHLNQALCRMATSEHTRHNYLFTSRSDPLIFVLFLLVVEERRNCFPEIQSEHLLSVPISWGRRPYLSSHPAVRRWPSTNSPQKGEPRLSANLSDHVVFKAARCRCEAEMLHSPEEKEVLFPRVIVFSVGSFCGQNKEKMYWAARNTKKKLDGHLSKSAWGSQTEAESSGVGLDKRLLIEVGLLFNGLLDKHLITAFNNVKKNRKQILTLI